MTLEQVFTEAFNAEHARVAQPAIEQALGEARIAARAAADHACAAWLFEEFQVQIEV